MSIGLNAGDLANTQQMEVAVCGPDGASHLILCTGIAHLRRHGRETYTFPVGPQISRRQFVGVIASGALAQAQKAGGQPAGDRSQTILDASLLSITAGYDESSGRVIASIEAFLGAGLEEASISYQVSILAELTANLHTR